MRYDRVPFDQNKGNSVREHLHVAAMQYQVGVDVDQANDLALLREVLAHPHRCQEWDDVAKGYIAWISAVPRRTLPRKLRENFKRALRAAHINRREGIMPPVKEMVPFREPVYAHKNRPDWMQDSTKLPKRPPTAK